MSHPFLEGEAFRRPATKVYSVTVNAFDRQSVMRINAIDEDEAREMALDRVHFKVTVKEQR